MTAKDCWVWKHQYQGWGACPIFPDNNLHMDDPVCDNNCVEFVDAVVEFGKSMIVVSKE